MIYGVPMPEPFETDARNLSFESPWTIEECRELVAIGLPAEVNRALCGQCHASPVTMARTMRDFGPQLTAANAADIADTLRRVLT